MREGKRSGVIEIEDARVGMVVDWYPGHSSRRRGTIVNVGKKRVTIEFDYIDQATGKKQRHTVSARSVAPVQ